MLESMARPAAAVPTAAAMIALVLLACTSSDPAAAPPGTDGRTDGGSAAADGAPGRVPTGPPAVAFVGRVDRSDPDAPRIAWPGVRIIARFEGTGLTVRLDEPKEPDQEGPSEFDVMIDGKLDAKLVLEHGEHEYTLAEGLPRATHVVELYKRSEAQNGVTRLLGFDYGPGGKLLAPPVRPARRIEIIGDSAASAFGVEGVGEGPDCPGEDWGARWQNFHVSWGAKLGELFDADVHGTVYSGKGFSKNIWRPDTDTLGQIYGRSNPLDPDSTFALASWTPDVVVIMAGGNDFAVGQPEDDGPATLNEFIEAYDDLVATVRRAYPEAHLFLALSASLTDDEPEGRDTRTNVAEGIATIVTGRTSRGDKRIHSTAPPVARPSELTGCDGHGSPEYHARIANDLARDIRARAGW
jgi:lysophospholipase L1-like esterase